MPLYFLKGVYLCVYHTSQEVFFLVVGQTLSLEILSVTLLENNVLKKRDILLLQHWDKQNTGIKRTRML